MKPCTSWLGHKFEPRYNTLPPDLSTVTIEGYGGLEAIIKALTSTVYVKDVCVRCGASTDDH